MANKSLIVEIVKSIDNSSLKSNAHSISHVPFEKYPICCLNKYSIIISMLYTFIGL